ncbi:Zinc finger CCCH domain-containing protein 36 [Auxenochlorella protothecoides]|uniref:Zinc finger CCCH domain-containing protein 36 n=1 Tax=Auxenochlorella protothecoides TaxID=3075 RepID=A0A087SGU9_AUXPR|nr:Zinc finger CCCH domain-containing protein 36 [Auxenochlorella protothecoides]KFM24953.1 Zinc finger CCCH domain-containing protein 36 [Auxenochlorella protothecoides]
MYRADRGSYDDSGRKGFRGTEENSKTRLCTRWLEGNCRFGNRCNFAHGEAELRGLPPRSRGPSGGPYSQTPDGEHYFHHRERNETQWDPPAGWTGTT